MLEDKSFVSNSDKHVHIWVRNNGNDPRQTEWKLAITRNANDPFHQPQQTSWSHTGQFGQQQATQVDQWLRQNNCGNMYQNLIGKIHAYATTIQGVANKK